MLSESPTYYQPRVELLRSDTLGKQTARPSAHTRAKAKKYIRPLSCTRLLLLQSETIREEYLPRASLLRRFTLDYELLPLRGVARRNPD